MIANTIPEVIYFDNDKGNKVNNCFMVSANGCDYFFSYKQLVAFRGIIDGKLMKLRTTETWSNTTARHMRYMGVKEWNTIDFDELVYYLNVRYSKAA